MNGEDEVTFENGYPKEPSQVGRTVDDQFVLIGNV